VGILAKDPACVSVMDVVEALEGETCLVRCVKQASSCDRISIYPTRDVWQLLGEKIN